MVAVEEEDDPEPDLRRRVKGCRVEKETFAVVVVVEDKKRPAFNAPSSSCWSWFVAEAEARTNASALTGDMLVRGSS